MFGLCRWRLKRRQRALALAWCGDQALAEWLLAESQAGTPGARPVEVYRRMATCWLQSAASRPRDAPGKTHRDASSPGDPVSCRIRQRVARMPLPQCMTLSLIDVARLSYRETAGVMGISLFEVQYHIVTARRELLDELSAHGNEHASLDPAESC